MGADLGYNMTWQGYDEDSDYVRQKIWMLA